MTSGRPPLQGTSYVAQSSRGDLENRLTYQDLLRENKDLKIQVEYTMALNDRVGRELSKMNLQYGVTQELEVEMMPVDRGLYDALQNNGMLSRYIPILDPLLKSYDMKAKKFDETYQKLHEQFLILGRKYDDILADNKKTKQQLQMKNKQLQINQQKEPVESKMFTNLINQQINQRQELLAEQNNLITSKFKQLEIKAKQLGEELRQKTLSQQTDNKRLREVDEKNQHLNQEVNNLKGRYSELQAKTRQLENKQAQLNKAASRTNFQISQLHEQIEELKKTVNRLRSQKDFKGTEWKVGAEDGRRLQQLQKQVAYLKAELTASQNGSQVEALKKQTERLSRESGEFKQSQQDFQQQKRILLNQKNQLNGLVGKLESEINIYKTKQSQLNKTLADLAEKNKRQSSRQLKDYDDRVKRVEQGYEQDLEQKHNEIRVLKQQLEKLKFQKENIERQVSLSSHEDSKLGKTREMARQLERLNDQLRSAKEGHGDQINELSQEVRVLKTELTQMQRSRGDMDQKEEEIKRLRQQLDKVKGDMEGLLEQKKKIIADMKELKTKYQVELRKKQAAFDGKIGEIRELLEESYNKERQFKEEVNENSKKSFKTFQEIKNVYNSRITELQGQIRLLTQKFSEAQTYKKITKVREEVI